MERPEWVTDKASWRKHCRRVVARTTEFIEGKVSVTHCAREIVKLEFWLRAESDPDFATFKKIKLACEGLPDDGERQRWPGEARDIEQKKIRDVEGNWHDTAVLAAKSLLSKFESAPNQ